MFFIGGGFGGPGGRFRGQYPRATKTPLNPPPQNPPFFKFGSGGGLSMISDFRESPPPLVSTECCIGEHPHCLRQHVAVRTQEFLSGQGEGQGRGGLPLLCPWQR